MEINEKSLRKASYFYPIANRLSKVFENLNVYLYQAEINVSLVEYIAYSLYGAFSLSFMFLLGMFLLYLFTKNALFLKLLFALPFLFLMVFYSVLYKPKVYAIRRARKIDEELPYALRHMLIQIRAGIPIYQTFISLTKDYGELSEEFKKIVKKINSGYSEVKALEESILRSSSDKYRKAFWQILNSLKTGTDVEKPLENVVNEIIKEQILAIKDYGHQLNPLTLMYMMVAIIMPSLGITFLMIISSFAGFSLSDGVFIGILVFLIFFQWSFLNLIKSKRPNVKI